MEMNTIIVDTQMCPIQRDEYGESFIEIYGERINEISGEELIQTVRKDYPTAGENDLNILERIRRLLLSFSGTPRVVYLTAREVSDFMTLTDRNIPIEDVEYILRHGADSYIINFKRNNIFGIDIVINRTKFTVE